MTQTSRFWDGVSYDNEDISFFYRFAVGSFVLPKKYTASVDVGDELRVTTTTTVGKVKIFPGEAFVYGAYYINTDEVEIDIPSTIGVNPAIYVVTLRYSAINQEVRPYVVEGTPAVIPSMPAINTIDLALGWVWVPGTYDDTVDTVAAEDIHDFRNFFDNGWHAQHNESENLIPNAEFLAWSGGNNTPPDGWKLINTPTITLDLTGSHAVGRCRSLDVESTIANEGIQITVPISYDGTDEDQVYTLSGFLATNAGKMQLDIQGVVLGGASVTLKTVEFNHHTTAASTNTSRFVERITVSPATYDALKVRLYTDAVNSGIDFWLPSLVKGYIPQVAWHSNEIIWLDNPLTDVAWTSSAKSSATELIDLTTNFQSLTKPYMRGVIATVRCRDSGSAAAGVDNGVGVGIYSQNGTLELDFVSVARLPNDTWREKQVYFPVDPVSTTPSLSFKTVASGAGTLDVTIEIVGYIT